MNAKQALLFASLANSHTPFAGFIGLMCEEYSISRWYGIKEAWKILQNVTLTIRGLQSDRRSVLIANGRWAYGGQVLGDSAEFFAGLTRLRFAVFLRFVLGRDQAFAAKREIDGLLVAIERASLYRSQYPCSSQ